VLLHVFLIVPMLMFTRGIISATVLWNCPDFEHTWLS